jgi:HK97 family phage portal protein
MGLLSRLEKAAALERKGYSGEIVNTTSPKLAWYGDGHPTVTGKTVNETSAMRVTAMFACVRLLSETKGSLPSAVYRVEKSGNSVKVDHPLSDILVERPNIDMDGVTFRETGTANLAVRGNCYDMIERRTSDGNVASLYPIPASQVTVKRNQSTNYEIRYEFQDRGKKESLPPEKIWHRRLFSFNGLVGLSPLECAREALALAMAGEEFNSRLFAQGLMPSARISFPNWLNDDQRARAREKVNEMYSGLYNMGKPLMLEGGMKVESGLFTPEDAQFLALRQFTVVEICRLLGIKPHMVASLEQATYNNIERLSQEFLQYTMTPYLTKDERGAQKLFAPADRGRYFYRYNVEGLLRADSAARASLYSILLQNGVFSRNEVRALENRNKSDAEGMDDFTTQTNMGLIQLMEQLQLAQIAKNEAQAAP